MKRELPHLVDFLVSSDGRGGLRKAFGRFEPASSPQATSFVGDSFILESSHLVFRGLHGQVAPFDQSKAVLVLEGAVRVFCVEANDGVPDKRTLTTHELTPGRMGLLAPQGWAVGVLTVSEASLVWVSASKPYRPDLEFTVGIKTMLPEEAWRDWKFSPKDAEADVGRGE